MGYLTIGLVISEFGIAWLYMKETNKYFCIASAGSDGHRGSTFMPTQLGCYKP